MTFASLGAELAELAAYCDSDDANSADASEGGNSASPSDFAGRYADLESLFGDFDDCPDFGYFDGLLDGADALVKKLSRGEAPNGDVGEEVPDYANPALDHFGIVDGYVDDWQGDAAVAFHEQFLAHSTTYTQNQFLVAVTLRGALRCEQEIWYNARKSVQDVGDKTKAALEDYLDGKPGNVEWAAVIAIVGTVVSSIGGGGLALLGATTGVFSAALGQDMSGNTPEKIVQEARDGITKIKTDIAAEEEKVIKALNESRTYLTANREPEFVGKPGAWDLVDADPGTARSPEVIGGQR
ncbi:hypothetical protein GCM10023340_02180 [Nocardioides marinquilinus]|uniref:ESX-1 secretion-associated protein EspA/EspE-like domain-containing protein n=1 Tax=Nocardioides marinquilinus TaxID=1210400 RepID=A0ABP9PBQ8_9ACTN